ncbi:MAG: hypothetical protein ACPG31_11350, partial [Planctomycetota bacterium]
MKFFLPTILAGLAVWPLHAQEPADAADAKIAAALQESLASAAGGDGQVYQLAGRALYDEVMLLEGEVEPLLAVLKERLQAEDLQDAQRIALLRLQTAALQRQGDMEAALASVEAELELDVDPTAVVQRGQLLDCLD